MEIEFKFKVTKEQIEQAFKKAQVSNIGPHKVRAEDTSIKNDLYYYQEGSKDPLFRIRSETWRYSPFELEDVLKTFFAGWFEDKEKINTKTCITHKVKRVEEGVEVNQEFEIKIDNSDLDTLNKFISFYKLQNNFRKTKVCCGFKIGDFHLEFVNFYSHYFAEIEYTKDELDVSTACFAMEEICKYLGLDCSKKINESWDKVLKEINNTNEVNKD